MIGQTLAHYRIEEKLGEGGMGVVYRALDTHLDRPVAIKVLRAGATADPERKKRFVQEAKAASALNHPNIIHIYDIDNAGGVDFMAMEYVDGKTLDHWIGRRGLETGSVLKYAVQIADALAAAHAVPLIHRDIKPGNIMVTEAGHVKVLDFGLAKLVEPTDQERTATLGQTPRTQEGTILGTVAYMSPEQAAGRKLDARSDIFSFGSVLYEMVTGQRAFQGENQISTLAAILNKEPKPVSEQLATVPRDLERVISRCLRKDPARRIQTMIDLKVALEELKEESDSGRLSAAFPAAQPPAARRFWPAVAVAAVILAAAAAVLVWTRSRPPAPAENLALTRLTSDSGLTTDPAISADGKLVAYASDRGGEGNLNIWVQQVAGGKAVRLTSHTADDSDPVFSPDSSSIAFRSEREGGGIYVVSTLGGGDERLIAAQGRRPRFSPDGKLIAYTVGHRGGTLGAPGTGKIYVAPAGGGAPRQLFAEMASAGHPVWSPDGKRLLFSGTAQGGGPAPDRLDWRVAPLEGGPAVKTGAFAIFIRLGLSGYSAPGDWASGDRILFSASQGDITNLWQAALDRGTWQITGEPQRLTSGTGREAQPAVAASSERLVFASLAENLDLWSLPVEASSGKVTGQMERLTQDAGPDLWPALSADGSKLVFSSGPRSNFGLRLKNLTDGRETAVAARGISAEITADGTRVAYAVQEDRRLVTYLVTLGPNGPVGLPQKLCEDCGGPVSWSLHGKALLFQTRFGASAGAASLLKFPSGERVKIEGLGADAALSPDNRWLAFGRSPGPGRRQIFVAAFAGDKIGEPIPVTGGQELDSHQRWSPDGRLLYFFSDRDGFRCLWAHRLDPADRPLPDGLIEVQHLHRAQLSASDLAAMQMGLAVSRNRIVFTLNQRSGNIWMGERKVKN